MYSKIVLRDNEGLNDKTRIVQSSSSRGTTVRALNASVARWYLSTEEDDKQVETTILHIILHI